MVDALCGRPHRFSGNTDQNGTGAAQAKDHYNNVDFSSGPY